MIATGRAADLQHFTFGKHKDRPDAPTELAEYALHVMCPWRVRDAEGIRLGHGDYWRPSSDSVDDDAYEAGKVGSRLRDIRIEEFEEYLADHACRVLRVTCDATAGCVIDMEDGIVLDIFPDSSAADHDEVEFWRLFQPHLDTAHFVVSSNGIDRVAEA